MDLEFHHFFDRRLGGRLRETEYTTALGTTYDTYDVAGNRTQTIDANGRKITYAYQANRLTTETWYNAGGVVVNVKNYTYDAVGNMLTASDYAGTVTMTYDGNRLTWIAHRVLKKKPPVVCK